MEHILSILKTIQYFLKSDVFVLWTKIFSIVGIIIFFIIFLIIPIISHIFIKIKLKRYAKSIRIENR